jgi:hypothetical protein
VADSVQQLGTAWPLMPAPLDTSPWLVVSARHLTSRSQKGKRRVSSPRSLILCLCLAARCSHLLVGPASPRRCAWSRGLGLSRAGLWPPGAWSAAAPPRQPRSASSPWSAVANLAGTGLPRAVLLHLCRGRRRRRVESQIETFFRVHFA